MTCGHSTDMINASQTMDLNMRFENFLRTIDMGKCEDQLQREALLDLAMLFVVIDGEVAEDEQVFIENWIKDLTWKSETSIEEYQKAAMKKCEKVIAENDVEHFIAQQAHLLVDKHMKEQAIEMADEIANVDGVLDAKEEKALALLRSYLD